jgi:hypothetical protein
MRRIVLSIAVLGALALGACSGGGSVLNFNDSGNAQPDRTIVTVQGPSNIARVLPGAGLPITATGVRGSQNGTFNFNRFKWSAALTTGGQYTAGTLGNTKPCGGINITQSGVTVPYTADFGVYIAIDPTNEANIEFIPPTIVPAPPASTITPIYPYCVVVTATPIGGGAQNAGSITVAVVNPQNPLQ